MFLDFILLFSGFECGRLRIFFGKLGRRDVFEVCCCDVNFCRISRDDDLFDSFYILGI